MARSVCRMPNKRRCICVLGLYLSVSAMALLFLQQTRITTYLTVPSHSLEHHEGTNDTTNRVSLGHLTAADIKQTIQTIVWEKQKGESITPCFTSYVLPVNEQLKSRLEQKHMLSYFNLNSQYLVSVPKWQKELETPKLKNTTKYYIAAVLRVRLYESDKAKWTIRELKQWMHYQLWAGAEHIYICCHYLNKSENIDLYMEEYIQRGIVTLYSWDKIPSVPGSKTYNHDNAKNQIGCYDYILEKHKNEAVWHYNFDMDENPYVPNDTCEGFLMRYLQKVNPNISELKLANFVLEGQGDRTRDIFYDRINRITPKPLNGNVKPIYRVSMTTKAGMHGAQTTGKTVYPDYKSLIFIHYWGARSQNWQNDTEEMRNRTVEFNDVRNSIAVNVRHSLIAFGEYDAFATKTGP